MIWIWFLKNAINNLWIFTYVWAWSSCQVPKLWVVHVPGMPGTFSPHRGLVTHASRHVRVARAMMQAGIAN